MPTPEQKQQLTNTQPDTWEYGLPYSPPTYYTGNPAVDLQIMTGVYDPYEEVTQEEKAARWKRFNRVAYNRLLRKQRSKEAKRQRRARELPVFPAAAAPNSDDYPF